MKTIRRHLAAAALLATALAPAAQAQQADSSDDFGLWTSVEVQKKLNKQWSLGAEVEYRLQDGWSEPERFTAGVAASYRPVGWLKFDAGYKILRTYTLDEYKYKQRGSILILNKWTPAYWGTKHRVYASLSGNWKVTRRLTLALRERWQYTYRPEQTVVRYDVDGDDLEDLDESNLDPKVKSGKAKHVLRSRVLAEYRLPKKTGLTPYVSAEAYTARELEKMRYTAGVEWKANKHNAFDLGYRYQALHGDDDADRNTHALLVGYKFRF